MIHKIVLKEFHNEVRLLRIVRIPGAVHLGPENWVLLGLFHCILFWGGSQSFLHARQALYLSYDFFQR